MCWGTSNTCFIAPRASSSADAHQKFHSETQAALNLLLLGRTSSIHCAKMCKHSKSFCKQPNFNIPKHDKPTCHPTIKVLFALGKPLCQKKIWGSKSLSRVWFALYQSNPMSILPKYLLFHFLFKTYFLKHLFSVNWLEAKVASTVESI